MIKVVLAILMCSVLTACPAPGDGRNFESAKVQAEPVVRAIESFHRAHNAYPRSLEALVPAFLDAAVLREHVPGRPVSFDYRSDAPSAYRFAFEYSGPGRNTCARDESNIQWECNGHY